MEDIVSFLVLLTPPLSVSPFPSSFVRCASMAQNPTDENKTCLVMPQPHPHPPSLFFWGQPHSWMVPTKLKSTWEGSSLMASLSYPVDPLVLRKGLD